MQHEETKKITLKIVLLAFGGEVQKDMYCVQ